VNGVVRYYQKTCVKKMLFLISNRNKELYFYLMIICEFCSRPIPVNAPQSVHHLIPRSKGGKNSPTVILHHLCHKEIHITLSEAELARTYNNLEALREHPRLAKFISWVKKKTTRIFVQIAWTKEKVIMGSFF
jgi:5-methylcytosine-specific restriction endonuclease McrA